MFGAIAPLFLEITAPPMPDAVLMHLPPRFSSLTPPSCYAPFLMIPPNLTGCCQTWRWAQRSEILRWESRTFKGVSWVAVVVSEGAVVILHMSFRAANNQTDDEGSGNAAAIGCDPGLMGMRCTVEERFRLIDLYLGILSRGNLLNPICSQNPAAYVLLWLRRRLACMR